MSDSPEKDPVEHLLSELTKVTSEAQALAAKVTQALREARDVGHVSTPAEPMAKTPRRRRAKDRRKAQDAP
jgi:hypothetical protein